jgi:hypothetical protein
MQMGPLKGSAYGELTGTQPELTSGDSMLLNLQALSSRFGTFPRP